MKAGYNYDLIQIYDLFQLRVFGRFLSPINILQMLKYLLVDQQKISLAAPALTLPPLLALRFRSAIHATVS